MIARSDVTVRRTHCTLFNIMTSQDLRDTDGFRREVL